MAGSISIADIIMEEMEEEENARAKAKAKAKSKKVDKGNPDSQPPEPGEQESGGNLTPRCPS
jgi:hypothetical protein